MYGQRNIDLDLKKMVVLTEQNAKSTQNSFQC